MLRGRERLVLRRQERAEHCAALDPGRRTLCRRPPSLFEQVLKITAKVFNAGVGVLMLKEMGTNRLQARAKLGFDAGGDFSVEIGQGFSGGIAASGVPDMVLDPSHDGRVAN